MNPPLDTGARFRKCDFQIHTPRDSAWSGPFDPLADRSAFADALVADCRRKGLQAIAITDHHDLCLQKEVKLAADRELRSDGSLYPEEERLVVFPGVELTLATPSCQALLIFDANIAEATLQQMWGALRLAPSADSSAKTTTTHALHTDLSLGAIADALSDIRTNPDETNPAKFETLEGKFILLPNIKKGGHKSMIRDGFQSHFIAMPCVGGYIEGCNYIDLQQGNRDRIEGKIREWGKRSLGVFQTSDCREAVEEIMDGEKIVSFKDLGTWSTWVKWAEPSAEALRQACLAKKSRISHAEPSFPLLQIAGVIVSQSSFLGTVELGLNPQFNAFIGGRGTGKSSLLEYIRWALCDDPLPSVDDTTELPNFQQRRKALIDGTLRAAQGKVTVFYNKNSVLYRIERAIAGKGDTITVFGPSGVGETRTQSQIRSEFPIVSYAQKQLSCVGTLPEEINRLIVSPVAGQITEIQGQIKDDILPKLRDNRRKQIRFSVVTTQITETETVIRDRKEQLKGLQTQLNALGPEQEKIVQAHDALLQRDQWLNRTIEVPNKIEALLNHIKGQIESLGDVVMPSGTDGDEKLKSIADEVNGFSKKVIDQLKALTSEVESNSWMSKLSQEAVGTFQAEFADHLVKYDECLNANAKNQAQLDEIHSLNKVVGELEEKLDSLKTEKAELQTSLDSDGKSHWVSFLDALEKRANLLRVQCQTINNQALHEFRAEVGFCRNPKPIYEAMEILVTGKNIRESDSKLEAVADIVCTADHPIKKWAEIMKELDALIAGKATGLAADVPILKAAGFTDVNLGALKNGVSAETLEQIRYTNLDDQIVFNFRMGKNPDGSPRYIPFQNASPGQQATCLLRTLLGQSGAPLLIDQPEEDLDNEQIQILSERIAETKHNRQLLFVSHNANIVVNGDAELVVTFGYQDPGDNSRGKIAQTGSIDSKPIRDRITTVMEGGRDAFDLRKNKYGF